MAIRISQVLVRKFTNTNYQNVRAAFNECYCSRQIFKNLSVWSSTTPREESGEGVQKKKKTTLIPKITLLQGDEISVTTLEEAQKLSKRRDLKLVKIVDIDTKTQRPIYKLMTGSEYHAEDIKQREQKKKSKEGGIKGEKLMIINFKIDPHDLEVNINKMTKWIGKSYEVKVVINGDGSKMAKAEEIYSNIERAMKSVGRIVQKRLKGTELKFQILPPKKEEGDPKSNPS